MCGIAGIVSAEGERPERARIARMTRTLRHRGPDAEGLWGERNVVLGHRRLTVIDTSETANQPLFSEDQSVVVVFNGEIYNFESLVEELRGCGHQFVTACDSEVLVHGWEQWGPGLVERCRGMFAFAIYDRKLRELFIARDRLGKKPLYYTHSSRGLAFASEIKALVADGVSRDIDLAVVGEYMAYGNSVAPRTVYSAVRCLPPAHWLRMRADEPGVTPEITRYWRYRPRPELGVADEEWLDRIDETLREAVRLRLISDVPLGAFLSGGIDSSLVVAYMARISSKPVKTFCIGFDDARFDESRHAREVAAVLGTEHREERVQPSAIEVLPQLVSAYDEPFADPSAIPTYYVSKLTRKHVTVALSGDGGDELFMGYRHYLESHALERLGRWLTPVGRSAAIELAKLLKNGSWTSRALDRVGRQGFDLFHHAAGFSRAHLELTSGAVREALGSSLQQSAAEDFGRYEELDFLQRCQLMDITNYLPNQILVKVDRASMQHALEVRAPLLDHEVAELAAKIPAAQQIDWRTQKQLLRKLAYRYLPQELIDRPKQGFSVPLDTWFRGELAPLANRMVDDHSSSMWDYFDRHAVARRLQAHAHGRVDSGKVLWRLLFFHHWISAEEAAVGSLLQGDAVVDGSGKADDLGAVGQDDFGPRGHVVGDDGVDADEYVVADGDAAEDHGAGADEDVVADRRHVFASFG